MDVQNLWNAFESWEVVSGVKEEVLAYKTRMKKF